MVWRFKGKKGEGDQKESSFKLDAFQTLYTSKPPVNKYGV